MSGRPHFSDAFACVLAGITRRCPAALSAPGHEVVLHPRSLTARLRLRIGGGDASPMGRRVARRNVPMRPTVSTSGCSPARFRGVSEHPRSGGLGPLVASVLQPHLTRGNSDENIPSEDGGTARPDDPGVRPPPAGGVPCRAAKGSGTAPLPPWQWLEAEPGEHAAEIHMTKDRARLRVALRDLARTVVRSLKLYW